MEEERKKASEKALRDLKKYAKEKDGDAWDDPHTEEKLKAAITRDLAKTKKFHEGFQPCFPDGFKSYNFLGNTGFASEAISAYITSYFAKRFYKKGFCIDRNFSNEKFIIQAKHFHIEVKYKYRVGTTRWGTRDYGQRVDLKLKLFMGDPIFYIKDAAISGMVLKKHATNLDELIKLTDLTTSGMVDIAESYIKNHYLDAWKKKAQENFEWFLDCDREALRFVTGYALIKGKNIRYYSDNLEHCIRNGEESEAYKIYSIQKVEDKNPVCFDPTEIFNKRFADILNK